MKKIIPLLLAAFVGGCVASASPVLAEAVEGYVDATLMIEFTDLQTGARRKMACAPIPESAPEPTYH